MPAPYPTPIVSMVSQDILNRVHLKRHFIGSILITFLLLPSSPLFLPNNAKLLPVRRAGVCTLCRNSAHPGPLSKCFRTPPQSLPRPSSFHYQGSQCWFCNPQARKLVEDSGCVCLFYYHRLLIAREVRGLTSISSNCCESYGPLPGLRHGSKHFLCRGWGLGCRAICQTLSKFPHPMSSPFVDGP